jgi:hypothetical protein
MQGKILLLITKIRKLREKIFVTLAPACSLLDSSEEAARRRSECRRRRPSKTRRSKSNSASWLRLTLRVPDVTATRNRLTVGNSIESLFIRLFLTKKSFSCDVVSWFLILHKNCHLNLDKSCKIYFHVVWTFER